MVVVEQPSGIICPFRKIEGRDFAGPTPRKRFNEYARLMRKIADKPNELRLPYDATNNDQVYAVFEECYSAIEVPQTTDRGTDWRIGQLSWLRHLRLLDIQARNSDAQGLKLINNIILIYFIE